MSAIRVLHVSTGHMYGGIEAFLRTVAEQRHACPEMQPSFALVADDRLARELRDAGAPVHQLGSVRVRYPWTVLRARRALGKLLATHPYDVAICHGAWPHGLASPVLRRRRVPIAFFLHGPPDGRHWVERWAKRTAPDLVLSNSHYCAASAKILFPSLAPEVVHCPIPPLAETTPEARAERRRAVREKLGAAEDDVVVLQASRMEAWKGHSLLLRALSKLRTAGRWTVWIAGGPQLAAEEAYLAGLRETARTLGIAPRIQWLGQRSDVPDLMTAADVFCQPNLGPEPYGLVFVEALRHGLPVISVNFGGAAEIVTSDCGALVPAGDADAVAAALSTLIDNPAKRQSLGARGAARAAELADVSRQLGRLATHLKSIAA